MFGAGLLGGVLPWPGPRHLLERSHWPPQHRWQLLRPVGDLRRDRPELQPTRSDQALWLQLQQLVPPLLRFVPHPWPVQARALLPRLRQLLGAWQPLASLSRLPLQLQLSSQTAPAQPQKQLAMLWLERGQPVVEPPGLRAPLVLLEWWRQKWPGPAQAQVQRQSLCDQKQGPQHPTRLPGPELDQHWLQQAWQRVQPWALWRLSQQ